MSERLKLDDQLRPSSYIDRGNASRECVSVRDPKRD